MRRSLALFAVPLFVLACGDDDVSSTTTTTTTSTTSTSETATPTYEFAIQPEPSFDPTAGVDPVEIGEPITTYVYPGERLPLSYIELDAEGDPCPTGGTIELADETGAVLVKGTGAEVTIPDTAGPGSAILTVRCERDGEPGLGTVQPMRIAALVELVVTPTEVAAGDSIAVEVIGGCPAGSVGTALLTPEEGAAGVFGAGVALNDDGTATLVVPDRLPPGTLYATVQCFDGEDLALAFSPFTVRTG